jgi:hypothetical protein
MGEIAMDDWGSDSEDEANETPGHVEAKSDQRRTGMEVEEEAESDEEDDILRKLYQSQAKLQKMRLI